MTNHELLKRPEMITERRETNYDQQTLIEAIQKETVFVVGKVLEWDFERRCLKVSFGKKLMGFIPEDEITTKKLTYKDESTMPKEAFYLLYSNIIVEVVKYVDDCREEFMLSRKRSMGKALSQLNEGDIVCASVKSIFGQAVVVDVGAGNEAWIYWQEFSKVPYSNSNKTGFEKGDLIKVKITSILGNKLRASRKDANPTYEEAKSKYYKDECILGKVTSPRKQNTNNFFEYSYWIEIEPNVSGILDTHEYLEAGQIVDLWILSIKDKGFKLRLLNSF